MRFWMRGWRSSHNHGQECIHSLPCSDSRVGSVVTPAASIQAGHFLKLSLGPYICFVWWGEGLPFLWDREI